MSDTKIYPLGQPSFIPSINQNTRPSSCSIATRSPKKSVKPRKNTSLVDSPSPRVNILALEEGVTTVGDVLNRDRQNLDQELAGLGFHVDDKVIILDEYGNVVAHFIKVSLDNGHYAMIELDTDGYVDVHPEDPILEIAELSVDNNILRSPVDYGISEKTISGVSMQCSNGVCVVNPDKSHKSYIQGSSGNLGTMQTSCPVVKLSKVRESNQEVINDVASACKKMKAESSKVLDQTLATAGKNLESLTTEYRTFYSKQKTDIAGISKDISQLEQIDRAYCAKASATNLTPIDQKKRSLTQYNLKNRYQMLDRLVGIDQRIANLNQLLVEARQQLAIINKELATDALTLGKIGTPAQPTIQAVQTAQQLQRL